MYGNNCCQSINGLGWSIAKLLGRGSRGPCNAMVKGRTQLLYAMFDGELVLTLNSSGSSFSEVPILASQVSMVNGDSVDSNSQWQSHLAVSLNYLGTKSKLSR